MACAKSGQEDGQEDKTEAFDCSSDHYCSAAIGCFLKCKNDTKKLYAMVCKHVTFHAKWTFFVENKNLRIDIAKKIATDENPDTTFLNDVDIIEILDAKKNHIKTNYLNESGKKCDFRLYEGRIEDLFGETVFHCYRLNGEKDTKIEVRSGKVEPVPILNAEGIPTDGSNFVVKGTDGKPFAKPGDSGRIVAREVDGIIELVGIITWANCKRSQESSEDCSFCMFLPSAIVNLNAKYDMQLILHKTEKDTGKDDEIVEPGQVLRFAVAQKQQQQQ